VEADRHHVRLPRLGRIRTHESTRKLARRLEAGTARILSATASRDAAGRWFVSFHVLARRAAARPGHAGIRHRVVGVDVGVAAGSWLVAATPGGVEVGRVPAPKSLAAAQARLRRLQRQAARQAGPWDPAAGRQQRPSNRWRRTQARIGKTHARAAHVRTDALHKATTTRLAQHHQVIAVETLNVAGMRRAGGVRKRGLNRALADGRDGGPVWITTSARHWPRSGGCWPTRPPGTGPPWSKPAAGTRHRRPARDAAAESQACRWPRAPTPAATAGWSGTGT